MSQTKDHPILLEKNVIQSIKRVDPDRYRAALMASPDVRNRLMGLYAFHSELAKIPEATSEPMMGEIRYQWWRDCLDEIYTDKRVRRHEIATPLSGLVKQTQIPRFWLDRLIDGRARDIDPRPFGTLEAAKDYCRQTSGQLMQIAVHICEPDRELGPAEIEGVASAGLSWGLTGLARGYGYYHNSMLSGISFDEICEAAKAAFQDAKDQLDRVNRNIAPAMLYASIVPLFITKLTSSSHDPKLASIRLSPLRKQLKLVSAALDGKL